MLWSDLANDENRESTMKVEIKKSLGFDGLLKRWESASRMRQWINELKKEISERAIAEVEASSLTLNKTESENIADQKFEVELQQTFNKVIEKAEFLVKLTVPESFLAKD